VPGTTHFCVQQQNFQRIVGVQTNNEFGPGMLDLNREADLCVPSVIE